MRKMEKNHTVAVLTMLLLFKVAEALVAYDCQGDFVNKTTISLVDVPSCERSEEKVLTEEIQVAITQVSHAQELKVNRCFVKASHVVWRCGKWGGRDAPMAHYTTLPRISKEDCDEMINKGRYTPPFSASASIELSGLGYQESSFTSYGSIDADGDCTPGGTLTHRGNTWNRAIRITNLEITTAITTASVDFEENIVVFPNGVRCDYSKGSCEQAEYGYLFWDKLTPVCPGKQHSMIYQGHAQKIKQGNTTFVQMTHDGYDFQIKLATKTAEVCGFMSYFTEHPQLFITVLSETTFRFPKLEKVNSREINMLNYINSKLVYTMRHTKNEVDRLFRIFEKERCKMQNRISENMMTLAIVSPKEFAYQYFHEPGYTAVVRGEVVHVAKCNPVDVVPVPLNDGRCYNELQVSLSNQTMYVTPRTRILVPHGTIVACAGEISSQFNYMGKWVVQTPAGLIQVKSPEIITPDSISYEFETLEHLSKGGLYTSASILEYQKILISPMEESIVQSRIRESMRTGAQLPDGYMLSRGISLDDVKFLENKLKTWASSLGDTLKEMAAWFSVVLMIAALIKIVLGAINACINFRILRQSESVVTSLLLCLFDSLTSIRHQKNEAFKTGGSYKADHLEMLERLPSRDIQ